MVHSLTDETLDVVDKLIQLLKPVAEKWMTLAQLLSIPESSISKFAKRSSDQGTKLEWLIKSWWKASSHDIHHRLAALITALKDKQIGKEDLVSEILKGVCFVIITCTLN